MLIGLLTYDCI